MKRQINKLKKRINELNQDLVWLEGEYREAQSRDAKEEYEGIEMSIYDTKSEIDDLEEEIEYLQIDVDIKELVPKVRKLEKKLFKE